MRKTAIVKLRKSLSSFSDIERRVKSTTAYITRKEVLPFAAQFSETFLLE